MAKLFSDNRFDTAELKPQGGASVGNWGMKTTRKIDGRVQTVRLAKLDEDQQNEFDDDAIGNALIKQAQRGDFNVDAYEDKDGNLIPNRSTGFSNHVQKLAANKRTSSEGRGSVNPFGEQDESDIEEELAKQKRRASGRSGFADYKKADRGSEFHDDDRQDFETDRNDSSGTGPVGFGDSFHGTPEDDMPEDRDKKEPYGGNAIGGSVMPKKSRFNRTGPGEKMHKDLFDDLGDIKGELQDEAQFKGNDGDNDDLFEQNEPTPRTAGSGTTREEGDSTETVTPLTHENPRTQPLLDMYKNTRLPQEPARIDVPGHDGGGKDMIDPLGDEESEFKFNEEGDPSLPGVSQGYPDKKVKATPIVGRKKITSRSGKIYTGQVVDSNSKYVIVDGLRVGDVTRKKYKVLTANITSMTNYNLISVQKIKSASIDGLYAEVDAKEKQMSQVKVAGSFCAYCNKAMNTEFDPNTNQPEKQQLCSDCYKKKDNQERSESREGRVKVADSALGKDDDVAKKDNSKGKGEFYGDDKALKDQLNFHEQKVAKLNLKKATLLRSSEIFEEAGDEIQAEACLVAAEKIANEIKNDSIRVAQLKKEASTKSTSRSMFYDNHNESGTEGLFE